MQISGTREISGNQLYAIHTEIKAADSLASIKPHSASDLFAVFESIVANEVYQAENIYTCLQHFHVSCRYALLAGDVKFIKVMNSHWQRVRYLIANDLMITIPQIDPTVKRTTNCWMLMKSPMMSQKIFREGAFRSTLLNCTKGLPSFDSVTSCEIPLSIAKDQLDRWLEVLELVDLNDHAYGKEVEDYILGHMPPQIKHCFLAEQIDLEQAKAVCAIFEVLSLNVQVFRDSPNRATGFMQAMTRIYHFCPELRSTMIGLIKPHLLVLRPFMPKDMHLVIDQRVLHTNSLFLATVPEFSDCLMQDPLQHDFQQLWSKAPEGQVVVDYASLPIEDGSFKQYLRISEKAEAFLQKDKISAQKAKEIVTDLPKDHSVLLLDLTKTRNLLRTLNRIYYVCPEYRDVIADFFASRNIASLLPNDALVDCGDGEIRVNSIFLQRIPYFQMLLSSNMAEGVRIIRNWLDLEADPIKVKSELSASVMNAILAFVSSGDTKSLDAVHPIDLWHAGDALAIQDQDFYNHIYSSLINYVMRGTDVEEIQSVLVVIESYPDHHTNFAALKALCIQRLEMLKPQPMDESVKIVASHIVENAGNSEQSTPAPREKKLAGTKSRIKNGFKKFFKK